VTLDLARQLHSDCEHNCSDIFTKKQQRTLVRFLWAEEKGLKFIGVYVLTPQRSLCEKIEMFKNGRTSVTDGWVPKLLTAEHKRNRLDITSRSQSGTITKAKTF
jgi:hypothetical protein